MVCYRTLQVRIKDKHAKFLNQAAIEVNQVWNKANELNRDAYRIPIPLQGWMYAGDWLSGFDLQKQMGEWVSSQKYTINSVTVQAVIAEHATRRNQFKKCKLSWRKSSGTKRSLGWIPFKKNNIDLVNGQIRYAKQFFKFWDSYDLQQYKNKIQSGSFSQDSRGRWYCNLVVEVPKIKGLSLESVGIDLGLKSSVFACDGVNSIELVSPKYYRQLEEKLASAQRANKKDRVRVIHTKIKNQRKDTLHKFTTILANQYGVVVVGNLSIKKFLKTRLAKSFYDTSLSTLTTILKSKVIARSGKYLLVNESYSTQTCSTCWQIPSSAPKGLAGLGIREWTCCECGTTHNRDENAAKVILARGHARLAEGISVL